jgi:preprotein translocase subunit SecA
MVQREHFFSIVDEIDSCLIDEARTPLVISGAAEDKTNKYISVDKLIKNLDKKDYEIDEKDRNILLTNDGINNVEKIFSSAGILKNNNFYDPENLSLVHHVNQALRANHLFQKGKDYIIQDNTLKIIDELTGRILEGRRYGDGLHQALEAKEKIDIQSENQTLASITYQNYFKLYEKISGCTGTAITESQEFFEIYNLQVVVIPTNKEMIRQDLNDQIFRTENEKNDAIIKKIDECHKSGQPILVFTSSINKSEVYSKLLSKVKIKHLVLNAKNHENEAEIIANAGKEKSVIITTSISGRGVDIQLGGRKGSTPNDELKINKEKIKSLGGLLVIGTERMESRRVDNQARGRSGRQGDEGCSIFYVSLEDDLMRIFGSESMNNILKKLGLKDGESIDHPWINKALERAQQKVEARNFDIRKTLIKFDNVLNDQRHVIFSQRKNVMNSNEIFKYSDDFLNEIIQELIELKIRRSSNPKNNDFENRLRLILGKNYNEEELKKLISLSDKDLKENVILKFKETRDERIKLLGKNESQNLEKRIFLQTIDLNWKSHIQYLEQLRQVIGLRSYGQRDPLVEYKKEAFDLFENLLNKLKLDFLTILMNLKIVHTSNKEVENTPPKKINPKYIGKKMKRNEPCFCGSNKKYKHCCGAL